MDCTLSKKVLKIRKNGIKIPSELTIIRVSKNCQITHSSDSQINKEKNLTILIYERKKCFVRSNYHLGLQAKAYKR
jgi:hypothetical protein